MAEIMGLNADYGVDDVLLCGLPLFHVNGVMVTGLAPFHRGAQVLLAGPQGYRNPTLIQDFWKLVERYRVTSFSGVPTIYARRCCRSPAMAATRPACVSPCAARRRCRWS